MKLPDEAGHDAAYLRRHCHSNPGELEEIYMQLVFFFYLYWV